MLNFSRAFLPVICLALSNMPALIEHRGYAIPMLLFTILLAILTIKTYLNGRQIRYTRMSRRVITASMTLYVLCTAIAFLAGHSLFMVLALLAGISLIVVVNQTALASTPPLSL